jgi:uncharacterized protein (TIGR02452 family)
MSKTRDKLETMIHQNRIVWEETGRYADNFGRVKPAESIRDISCVVEDASGSRVIKVFNESLLTCAAAAAEVGLHPLVVNAGSDNDPFKVLAVGSIGTEWDLFRRSNLHASLANNDCYPLRDGTMLYAQDITVFRTDNFKIMRNPYKISVLTAPPLRRPGLVSSRNGDAIVDSYQNPTEEDRMRDTIDKIFRIALAKHHRCIIFDDYGCQRNCENPIHTVIEMFNDTIRKYPIKYVFFAVSESLLEQLNRDDKKSNPTYKNYITFDKQIKRS